MSQENHEHMKPSRAHRGCGVLFFCIMLVVGSIWGAALGVFIHILDDAKDTMAILEDFRPKIGSKVYSWDGAMLGEFTIEQRQLVPLNEMPIHLQKAFVATEDDKFFEHKGVRIAAIINAAKFIVETGRTRGGSTITQQVVRNVEPLSIGLEQTLQRKIREAIVALQVEREFTKDEILELYLNQIFLGISAHGVEAASWQYFAKSCRDVTLSEAATLAAITSSPNRLNPIRNLKGALQLRNEVLRQMLENGFINQEEHDTALAEDLGASVVTPEERVALREAGKGAWTPSTFKAQYFVEEVRRFVLAQYDTEEVFEDGLEIHTTIDMRLQSLAEEAMLTALDAFDAKKLKYLQARNREHEFIPVSGGLVCIDNRTPYEGYVRAMVGGRNFQKEKYNTVTQAKRQPGSSVKPFVWAAAIANGMTPSTVIVDEPFQRLDGAGNVWRPQNFDGKYHGPMTIRHALEKSVNIVSIKLVEQLGMPMVRSYLQRCGITTPIDDVVGLTIALGTPEVTLLDHCVAYSCFASNGVRHDPIMVTEIKNRDGIMRYDARQYAQSDQAMDPKVAFVVNHMLQGVCEPGGGYYPTGHRTSAIERPRGGKTGTTNSSRNVWFCGFTKEFTCVVWVGYRDNRPLGRGADYTGGRLACPIWTQFMKGAHEGIPKRDFKAPSGVNFFKIDRFKGTAGGSYEEAYVEGTAPPTQWYYDLDEDAENLDEMDTKLLEAL